MQAYIINMSPEKIDGGQKGYTMKEILSTRIFEQNIDQETTHERGLRAAQISLDLGTTAMLFSRVERVPRYADGERENNAEHSFMLSLVAPELVRALDLPLDTGLIAQYANVHDLVELKTGDIATFHLTDEQQINKTRAERLATAQLMAELPPYTGRLLYDYERQADPEARFVRYVDKLLPVITDIVGAGDQVLQHDYDVHSREQLEQCYAKLHVRLKAMFGDEFPEIEMAHHILCELFETRFMADQERESLAQTA